MGSNVLTRLIDDPGAEAGSVVLSRRNGVWEGESARFGDDVRALAAALSGYGLGAGRCAAVLGPEGGDTLRAGLSVIAAGATLVPLAPSLSDDELRRALATTGAVHAIASDERQLARVLALRPDLSALELVLLMSAAPSERRPAALLVETALSVGRASLESDPSQLRQAFDEGEGHPACMIVGASGTVREIARSALVALADGIARDLDLAKGTSMLSALPVGTAERFAASLAALGQGTKLLLPDPEERPDAGLGDVPADAVILDVTGLERLFRAWTEDIEGKPWLGRTVTQWALRQGREANHEGWKHRIADRLALRDLRNNIGARASRLDVFVMGGRQGSAEVDAFFAATGLLVRYHAPEAGPALAR